MCGPQQSARSGFEYRHCLRVCFKPFLVWAIKVTQLFRVGERAGSTPDSSLTVPKKSWLVVLFVVELLVVELFNVVDDLKAFEQSNPPPATSGDEPQQPSVTLGELRTALRKVQTQPCPFIYAFFTFPSINPSI